MIQPFLSLLNNSILTILAHIFEKSKHLFKKIFNLQTNHRIFKVNS